VCEAAGADWLPFSMLFEHAKSFGGGGKNKTSAEAIWHRDDTVPHG
jgi:hypothetical protein